MSNSGFEPGHSPDLAWRELSINLPPIQHRDLSRILFPIQKCIFRIRRIQGKMRSTVWTVYSVRTKYSAQPNRRQYLWKKPKFLKKIFLQKIQRVIQQHILEQKTTFLALKVENRHVLKKLFLFFVKILPAIFFGIGEFSPIIKPDSKRSL